MVDAIGSLNSAAGRSSEVGGSGPRVDASGTVAIVRASGSASIVPDTNGQRPVALPPSQIPAAPPKESGSRSTFVLAGKRYELKFHVPLARKGDDAGSRTGRLSRNILPIKVIAADPTRTSKTRTTPGSSTDSLMAIAIHVSMQRRREHSPFSTTKG